MPLSTEVGLCPGHIVSDGDLDPPTERGTVRLCGFRHISTSGLAVGTSRASFIAIFERSLQVTVRRMLRGHSPVCPLCNAGVLWLNG